MLHCIAIDDEPLSLDILRTYSASLESITLAATFTSTVEARRYLDNNTVDLILLDIEMADIDGLSFYRSLNRHPMVIFTTAYSNYATQGFEVSATDYLVKPIDPVRFHQAIHKACRFKTFHQQLAGQTEPYLQVRSEYQTRNIPVSDILYIEGLNNHVKIYTDKSLKPVLSMISMKEMMNRLPARRFLRIHRSYIVHLSKITAYNNRFVFIGNTQLPIGDTYRDMSRQLNIPRNGSPLF